MNQEQKKTYSQTVGFGLILGAAIGSFLDFASGSFTGILAASGTSIGIVIGAIVANIQLSSSLK